MPKEGFKSVTIPDRLYEQIENFVKNSQGIIRGNSQALSRAWEFYDFFRDKINSPVVKIGSKKIGNNQKVFIVAEIGLNHNGSIENVKKLIDIAKYCGCDAVKFQKRTPDICVPKEQKNIMRETPWGLMKYIDYRYKIELSKEDYIEIDKYCKKKNILWFASSWDIKSVEFLEKFNVPCYKIPSSMLTNKKLLEKIRQTGKPIILSTGMSTMEQVKKAVEILGEDNLILLHCNSAYPVKENELNLSVIKTFKKYFNCPIGYSGHETGLYPSIMAVVLGSNVIERHITLDRAMWGSDQSASLEKQGLKKMVNEIRSIPIYLGSSEKKVCESEILVISKLRNVDDI